MSKHLRKKTNAKSGFDDNFYDDYDDDNELCPECGNPLVRDYYSNDVKPCGESKKVPCECGSWSED